MPSIVEAQAITPRARSSWPSCPVKRVGLVNIVGIWGKDSVTTALFAWTTFCPVSRQYQLHLVRDRGAISMARRILAPCCPISDPAIATDIVGVLLIYPKGNRRLGPHPVEHHDVRIRFRRYASRRSQLGPGLSSFNTHIHVGITGMTLTWYSGSELTPSENTMADKTRV